MAKFLCSFGGSILPRPLDGRLRYVGGDTRIVMLPRDIPYSDLAARMRELYEDADIIKYQQPDEDLDALVSVVNDDDVVNMMEEYDKLIAAGEGFTRLRVFLFSLQLDDDAVSAAVHYRGDDRDTERRYVDALNSLGDMRSPSSPVSVEQLFGVGGIESGIPDSLRHLNVPRPSQNQRFQVGAEDFDERIPDDFVRHSPKYRHYEPQSPPHVDNLVWLPPGAVIQQTAGFPGNLGRSGNFLDGNSVYDSRSPFQKGPGSVGDPRYVDPRWRPVPQTFDQSSMTNEYSAHPSIPRQDYFRPAEHYVVGQDVRLENGVYVKEQAGGHPPIFYNESHSHDRAWHAHPNQSHQRYEDPRLNLAESVQQQPGAPLIEILPERASAGPMLASHDGKVSVAAVPLADQLSRLDISTTKKFEGPEGERHTRNVTETKASHAECGDVLGDRVNLIPEFVASVKRAALEDAEKPGEVQPEVCRAISPVCDNDNDGNKFDENTEGDHDNDVHGSDQHKSSGIESTPAEAEALSKGLQTIKNDDLEEIRELGSGTYGSVFHGKWRGCDVAIKRIKASCFDGRPSERERLIADFWKEAQILSSLHHPNVVSFYGVVRDGPDGSLATVTEFMINGSLKQFLRKKDRTIDRRKRVILAMDAAFGMEYLHGKNIVHFDLKCENLLVNMRDPQKPICKIGDLGLSKVKQHTLVSGGVRGTLPWMAPELLSGKSDMVSEKIDVYSFGIVMWELLTGEDPYSEMRAAEIIGGIVNNSLRPQIPSWCDPEWRSLMESSWASEPTERPSFIEISQKLRKIAAAMNIK
ncbi:unnamed protein product [Alopecurus aequalis]